MKIKITILLLIIFLLPVLFSFTFYLYYPKFNFKPSHHGVLLRPAVQVKFLFDSSVNKQWKIVLGLPYCEAPDLNQVLFKLVQMHKMLGEDQRRVQLLLLSFKDCHLKEAKVFHQLILNKHQLTQFRYIVMHEQESMDKIYLIDPLDNLFMYYPTNINPMDVFKDLKLVLRASQIG